MSLTYDKHIFNSAYDYVNWDSKLPPKIKPRPSTWEKMADPISQRFTDWAKRYRPATDQCQVLFGEALCLKQRINYFDFLII